MNAPLRERIRVFDPKDRYAVVERRLPHWSQAGTVAFLTWRTWDSIPEAVLKEWLAERDAWLARHGIDPQANWRKDLLNLDVASVLAFRQLISDRWNDHLDACHGACVLRRPEISDVVERSLMHFDGERYDLTDFIVMPNHVHVLAAFSDEEAMLVQCESWKHFTAVKINRALGRKGRFWQQDGFDHLVRSLEQFEHYRDYIAENPRRAHLGRNEYRHLSKKI
jgi:putative transposase